MFRNPEFIRNAWTELTWKRLVSMPLMLVTLYLLAYNFNEKYQPTVNLADLYLLIFVIFTFMWGTRMTAEAVVKEINANTWSLQTMTAISPFKMAMGKLFGSTAYIWYGNAICLVLYALARTVHAAPHPQPFTPGLAGNILAMVMLGLIAHMLPLLVSLHSIRWRNFFEQFDLTFFQILGASAFVPLYFVLKHADKEVIWYGHAYTLQYLTVLFAAIFMVWGFVSLVNQIKTEFGQEPYPVSWLLFAATLAVVLYGFNDHAAAKPWIQYIGTITAFFSMLCLTYLTVCGESNMALRPHMIVKYFRAGQYKRLFTIMPRTLVTMPVIIVMAAILISQIAPFHSKEPLAYVIMALVFFMMRDFCFIYFWSVRARGNDKAYTVTPILILLASYTIVPAVIFNLGLNALLPFFIPFFFEGRGMTFASSAVLTVAASVAGFAVAVGLLASAVRRKVKELSVR